MFIFGLEVIFLQQLKPHLSFVDRAVIKQACDQKTRYAGHKIGFKTNKSLVSAKAKNMAVIGVREQLATNAPIPAKT